MAAKERWKLAVPVLRTLELRGNDWSLSGDEGGELRVHGGLFELPPGGRAPPRAAANDFPVFDGDPPPPVLAAPTSPLTPCDDAVLELPSLSPLPPASPPSASTCTCTPCGADAPVDPCSLLLDLAACSVGDESDNSDDTCESLEPSAQLDRKLGTTVFYDNAVTPEERCQRRETSAICEWDDSFLDGEKLAATLAEEDYPQEWRNGPRRGKNASGRCRIVAELGDISGPRKVTKVSNTIRKESSAVKKGSKSVNKGTSTVKKKSSAKKMCVTEDTDEPTENKKKQIKDKKKSKGKKKVSTEQCNVITKKSNKIQKVLREIKEGPSRNKKELYEPERRGQTFQKGTAEMKKCPSGFNVGRSSVMEISTQVTKGQDEPELGPLNIGFNSAITGYSEVIDGTKVTNVPPRVAAGDSRFPEVSSRLSGRSSKLVNGRKKLTEGLKPITEGSSQTTTVPNRAIAEGSQVGIGSNTAKMRSTNDTALPIEVSNRLAQAAFSRIMPMESQDKTVSDQIKIGANCVTVAPSRVTEEFSDVMVESNTENRNLCGGKFMSLSSLEKLHPNGFTTKARKKVGRTNEAKARGSKIQPSSNERYKGRQEHVGNAKRATSPETFTELIEKTPRGMVKQIKYYNEGKYSLENDNKNVQITQNTSSEHSVSKSCASLASRSKANVSSSVKISSFHEHITSSCITESKASETELLVAGSDPTPSHQRDRMYLGSDKDESPDEYWFPDDDWLSGVSPPTSASPPRPTSPTRTLSPIQVESSREITFADTGHSSSLEYLSSPGSPPTPPPPSDEEYMPPDTKKKSRLNKTKKITRRKTQRKKTIAPLAAHILHHSYAAPPPSPPAKKCFPDENTLMVRKKNLLAIRSHTTTSHASENEAKQCGSTSKSNSFVIEAKVSSAFRANSNSLIEKSAEECLPETHRASKRLIQETPIGPAKKIKVTPNIQSAIAKDDQTVENVTKQTTNRTPLTRENQYHFMQKLKRSSVLCRDLQTKNTLTSRRNLKHPETRPLSAKPEGWTATMKSGGSDSASRLTSSTNFLTNRSQPRSNAAKPDCSKTSETSVSDIDFSDFDVSDVDASDDSVIELESTPIPKKNPKKQRRTYPPASKFTERLQQNVHSTIAEDTVSQEEDCIIVSEQPSPLSPICHQSLLGQIPRKLKTTQMNVLESSPRKSGVSYGKGRTVLPCQVTNFKTSGQSSSTVDPSTSLTSIMAVPTSTVSKFEHKPSSSKNVMSARDFCGHPCSSKTSVLQSFGNYPKSIDFGSSTRKMSSCHAKDSSTRLSDINVSSNKASKVTPFTTTPVSPISGSSTTIPLASSKNNLRSKRNPSVSVVNIVNSLETSNIQGSQEETEKYVTTSCAIPTKETGKIPTGSENVIFSDNYNIKDNRPKDVKYVSILKDRFSMDTGNIVKRDDESLEKCRKALELRMDEEKHFDANCKQTRSNYEPYTNINNVQPIFEESEKFTETRNYGEKLDERPETLGNVMQKHTKSMIKKRMPHLDIPHKSQDGGTKIESTDTMDLSNVEKAVFNAQEQPSNIGVEFNQLSLKILNDQQNENTGTLNLDYSKTIPDNEERMELEIVTEGGTQVLEKYSDLSREFGPVFEINGNLSGELTKISTEDVTGNPTKEGVIERLKNIAEKELKTLANQESTSEISNLAGENASLNISTSTEFIGNPSTTEASFDTCGMKEQRAQTCGIELEDHCERNVSTYVSENSDYQISSNTLCTSNLPLTNDSYQMNNISMSLGLDFTSNFEHCNSGIGSCITSDMYSSVNSNNNLIVNKDSDKINNDASSVNPQENALLEMINDTDINNCLMSKEIDLSEMNADILPSDSENWDEEIKGLQEDEQKLLQELQELASPEMLSLSSLNEVFNDSLADIDTSCIDTVTEPLLFDPEYEELLTSIFETSADTEETPSVSDLPKPSEEPSVEETAACYVVISAATVLSEHSYSLNTKKPKKSSTARDPVGETIQKRGNTSEEYHSSDCMSSTFSIKESTLQEQNAAKSIISSSNQDRVHLLNPPRESPFERVCGNGTSGGGMPPHTRQPQSTTRRADTHMLINSCSAPTAAAKARAATAAKYVTVAFDPNSSIAQNDNIKTSTSINTALHAPPLTQPLQDIEIMTLTENHVQFQHDIMEHYPETKNISLTQGSHLEDFTTDSEKSCKDAVGKNDTSSYIDKTTDCHANSTFTSPLSVTGHTTHISELPEIVQEIPSKESDDSDVDFHTALQNLEVLLEMTETSTSVKEENVPDEDSSYWDSFTPSFAYSVESHTPSHYQLYQSIQTGESSEPCILEQAPSKQLNENVKSDEQIKNSITKTLGVDHTIEHQEQSVVPFTAVTGTQCSQQTHVQSHKRSSKETGDVFQVGVQEVKEETKTVVPTVWLPFTQKRNTFVSAETKPISQLEYLTPLTSISSIPCEVPQSQNFKNYTAMTLDEEALSDINATQETCEETKFVLQRKMPDHQDIQSTVGLLRTTQEKCTDAESISNGIDLETVEETRLAKVPDTDTSMKKFCGETKTPKVTSPTQTFETNTAMKFNEKINLYTNSSQETCEETKLVVESKMSDHQDIQSMVVLMGTNQEKCNDAESISNAIDLQTVVETETKKVYDADTSIKTFSGERKTPKATSLTQTFITNAAMKFNEKINLNTNSSQETCEETKLVVESKMPDHQDIQSIVGLLQTTQGCMLAANDCNDAESISNGIDLETVVETETTKVYDTDTSIKTFSGERKTPAVTLRSSTMSSPENVLVSAKKKSIRLRTTPKSKLSQTLLRLPTKKMSICDPHFEAERKVGNKSINDHIAANIQEKSECSKSNSKSRILKNRRTGEKDTCRNFRKGNKRLRGKQIMSKHSKQKINNQKLKEKELPNDLIGQSNRKPINNKSCVVKKPLKSKLPTNAGTTSTTANTDVIIYSEPIDNSTVEDKREDTCKLITSGIDMHDGADNCLKGFSSKNIKPNRTNAKSSSTRSKCKTKCVLKARTHSTKKSTSKNFRVDTIKPKSERKVKRNVNTTSKINQKVVCSKIKSKTRKPNISKFKSNAKSKKTVKRKNNPDKGINSRKITKPSSKKSVNGPHGTTKIKSNLKTESKIKTKIKSESAQKIKPKRSPRSKVTFKTNTKSNLCINKTSVGIKKKTSGTLDLITKTCKKIVSNKKINKIKQRVTRKTPVRTKKQLQKKGSVDDKKANNSKRIEKVRCVPEVKDTKKVNRKKRNKKKTKK